MGTPKIQKVVVLTSGGDSPGMNPAIRSVVRSCDYYGVECLGVYRGYQGLIEGHFEVLDSYKIAGIISRGGTVLKSARSKEFRTSEGRQKAFENIQKQGVDGLIIIGGDGTFTGGSLFGKETGIPVIGIPGTIDNDIHGTQFTLGFDTALNTALDALDKIRDTATSHNRVFFVEVMGRDAGHIAINLGIGAGAKEILIPEENVKVDQLITSLKKRREEGKISNIIVVAEGNTTGKNVYELKDLVEKEIPEYDVRVSVLGHMQRGGSPSCFDRVLATRMGVCAVESLLKGKSQCMVGVQDEQMILTSLEEAISETNDIQSELLRVAKVISH